MTARILVVDDIPANVKLLEARLLAEYFEVLTAADGHEALAICERNQVDLILLDIMMPGLDGFEVCERLKAKAKTARIPVVMVTALDKPADRVRGLRAGADDFLTKPVNDLQLISRVKSLLRLAGARSTSHSAQNTTNVANVLLVDARANSQKRITQILKPGADVTAISDPQAALFEAVEKRFELIIVNANFDDYDPLRLCSQFRSLERTRLLPILLITEQGDDNMVIRALDLGINDYIARPVDPSEFVARCDNLLNKRNRALHTPPDVEGDAKTYRSTKPPLAPVLFSFVDGRLTAIPTSGTISAPDRANASAALEVIINDAHRLDEALIQSNADYRLVEIFRTLSSVTSSGENIIKIGLVNIECLQMVESFDRAGELSPHLFGALRAQCLKTQMYVSQFEEWNKFSANAAETPIDESELPRLADTLNNLAVDLSRQTNAVDPNVPKSIEFFLGLVHEPGRTSKKAFYALISMIEGIALSVANYCSEILEGSAKSAADHLKKTFGVAAAATVLTAAVSYFDIAVKVGSTRWLAPAIEIIKKYIEALH